MDQPNPIFGNTDIGIKAIGHYSNYVELPNGLIYISGQKAWGPGKGEEISGSIEQQTEQILDNIEKILSAINLSLKNIIRVQCFLSDISNYERFNNAYSARLGNCMPVRCVVGGIKLRSGALVELLTEAYRH